MKRITGEWMDEIVGVAKDFHLTMQFQISNRQSPIASLLSVSPSITSCDSSSGNTPLSVSPSITNCDSLSLGRHPSGTSPYLSLSPSFSLARLFYLSLSRCYREGDTRKSLGMIRKYVALAYYSKGILSLKMFKVAATLVISVGLVVGVGVVVVLVAVVASSPTKGWSGRSLGLIDPTYASTYIPIIASVSEHQPPTCPSYFMDINVLAFLVPAGIIACFSPLSDASSFVILYLVMSVYFSGVMVRLMLVLAPAACIMSGIALSEAFDTGDIVPGNNITSPQNDGLWKNLSMLSDLEVKPVGTLEVNHNLGLFASFWSSCGFIFTIFV
ncbi:hypothetical protein LXL04_027341 [Taraxacum kok-saghyz]